MPPTPYEIEEAWDSTPTATSDDMAATINISLPHALAGFTRILTFKHLNGKRLKIEKTGITRHGSEGIYPGIGRWKNSKPGLEVVAERRYFIVSIV